MKIVINACFGGFGLSDKAYEWLIEKGVKVAAYVEQERGPDGRYLPEPKNDGEVIFDRSLYTCKWLPYDPESKSRLSSRYWESFIKETWRTNPLLIECIECLGEEANGNFAKLRILDLSDDIGDYYIHEYDGLEDVRTGEVYR